MMTDLVQKVHGGGERVSGEGRDARILVVEDCYDVGKILCRILENAGYEVVFARDGAEAIDLYEIGSSFDLLITDIVMPGSLQGDQLAKILRAKQPNLHVIFITGYADEFFSERNDRSRADIVLMKPTPMNKIQQAVSVALSG